MKCLHLRVRSDGDHVFCSDCDYLETEDQYTDRMIALQEYLNNELPDQINL